MRTDIVPDSLPANETEPPIDLDSLEVVQRRVLWLATRMIDHANHDRPNESGLKVGGHQASSASAVSIMTALWFGHLRHEDKVAIKPHAAPVYHAIKYLTGELDRGYLTRLRDFGGLQSYPSRTKDPDVEDFSTGSMGLGPAATIFAAATRRYLDAHGAPPGPLPRCIAIVGDAELDEGNVWEAITEPAGEGLGSLTWIVDVNRQSLDRVVPGTRIRRQMNMFEEAGWHVIEVKYGSQLQRRFALPGGEALREHLDRMSNEAYQSLYSVHGPDLRTRFLAGADPAVSRAIEDLDDTELASVVRNLGGHDLSMLLDAYRRSDEIVDRPSIVFAYTVKGWGLPIAGDPMNHAAMLTTAQIDELRSSLGLSRVDEWDPFPAGSAAGRLCRAAAPRLNNDEPVARREIAVPPTSGATVTATTSTQIAFGRILVALGTSPIADRLVTTSPDVSVSTNLGGWINKRGVYSPAQESTTLTGQRLLRWEPGPAGQHIELGISEMNLFLMLGQLGLAHELYGSMLLPIGTVYDPFVCRGLDAFIHAVYSGARFIVAGTPAGISLAAEGGAHQSTITAGIGIELPHVAFCEPAYAEALDWMLCDALADLARPDGTTSYFRLSTRPIDQSPFEWRKTVLGEERLRSEVIAGGYRLVEGGEDAVVTVFASGAVMPEVLQAAALLETEGVAATVVDVTSAGRLFTQWTDRLRTTGAPAPHVLGLLPQLARPTPIVTVHDASSHALAWLGGVRGDPVVPVGVDAFGESGDLPQLYRRFGLLPEQIYERCRTAIDRSF